MGSMGWSGQPGRSWVAWVGRVSLDDHGSMGWSGQPGRSWVAWVGLVWCAVWCGYGVPIG